MQDGSREDSRAAERRKSYCPECGKRAMPFAVRFGHQVRVLTYRCEECRHEWQVEAPAPPTEFP